MLGYFKDKLSILCSDAGFIKFSYAVIVGFTVSLISSSALAADANVIAANAIASSEELPGLVAAFCYALGLLLGVQAIFKIKEHVDNPNQIPLRTGVIRLLAGGGLFALPIIYRAAFLLFDDATLLFALIPVFSDTATVGFVGGLSDSTAGGDINAILNNIINSVTELPGLLTAFAYLLGLVFGVQGVLKIKEHVENPEQTPLKDSVVRFLTAGAMFALPTIFISMLELGGGIFNLLFAGTGLLGGQAFTVSEYAAGAACTVGGGTMGDALCNMIENSASFPTFLTAIAYMIGLALGLWGILKLRDHVQNPQQTSLSEGVSRLVAGGFFFALPLIVEVAKNTLADPGLTATAGAPITAGYNNASVTCAGGGPLGLDGALACLMDDVMGPLNLALNFFAFVAGMILIMIGISRLIKSAQEGARGPGGIGTIMTFLAGGALVSYNELVRAVSTSITGEVATRTFGTLSMSPCAGGGFACAEAQTAHATISAILQFVIIVGLISFVRGIFIIRGVAEGNQQASMMAGITHIIGGTLAVNLGPLINLVQTSLGIGGFGMVFT